MLKKLFHVTCCLLCFTWVKAQNSDDAYREPLKQVLTEIESQYGIKLRYSDDLVNNRFVTYARWRFRPDVEKTLANVLAAEDLSFSKTGDKIYKIRHFQYHLKTVEGGKEQPEYLSTLSHDAASSEDRKSEL